MMRVVASLLCVAASAALVASCSGLEANAHHEGVEHASAAKPAAAATLTAAQQAYKQAAERMHAGMSAAIPADPDVAFAQGMIPHHQGAIDMARVQLQYGKDPEMRKLAQDVIAAQEAEIAQLRAFLAERGTAASAAPVDHSAMGH